MSIRCVDVEPEPVPDWVPDDEPILDPARFVEMVGSDGRVRLVEARRQEPEPEPVEAVRLEVVKVRKPLQPAHLPLLQFPQRTMPLHDLNALDCRDMGVLAKYYLSKFLDTIRLEGTNGLNDIGASLMLMLRMIEQSFGYEAQRARQIDRLKGRPGQGRLFEV